MDQKLFAFICLDLFYGKITNTHRKFLLSWSEPKRKRANSRKIGEHTSLRNGPAVLSKGK